MTLPKLIASDLDGTLLNASDVASPRTIAALRAATDAGIEVVAATGRSHRSARPRLDPVGVIETAICSNGATVHDAPTDSVTLHRPVDDDALDTIVAALRARNDGVTFAWEVVGEFGWEHDFVALLSDEDRVDLTRARADEFHDSIEVVAPRGLTKLLVRHPAIVTNAWLDEVAPMMPPNVSVSTSGAPFVEVTGAGVDKASTLAMVCAERGVNAADVLVFGDQTNDIAMFRWAGRAVAMGNAHPVAKAAADEVVGSHDDDAVARVIEDVLAGR